MRREGFQHGTIKITGGYMKAPSRPTGHSKYTGKCKKARCMQCHSNPVSKSRDKAKGMYKIRNSDVVLNHRLVTWRVAADKNADWSKFSGVSATGMLDALLAESCWTQEDGDHEELENGYGDGFDDSATSLLTGCNIDQEMIKEKEEEIEIEIEESNQKMKEEEDDEDDMGFYEVGFVLEYIDEEGWYVVDEI